MTQTPQSLPSLFAGVTESDRADLVARATARQYPAHSVLYRQGETPRSLFLIQSGRVALTCTSTMGRQVLLRLVGGNEWVGIASLTADSRDIATAFTVEPTSVLLWDADLVRSTAVYPVLVYNALRMTLQYLKEYGDRHVALLSHTAEQRLARTLERLGATTGRPVQSGVEVLISNADLAALSDVGMFTTSRQLKRWEREGRLVKGRQRVVLCDANGILPEPRKTAARGRAVSGRGQRSRKR